MDSNCGGVIDVLVIKKKKVKPRVRVGVLVCRCVGGLGGLHGCRVLAGWMAMCWPVRGPCDDLLDSMYLPVRGPRVGMLDGHLLD